MKKDTSPPTPELDTIEDDYGPAGIDGYPVQVKVIGTVYTMERPAVHSADGSMNCSTSEANPIFQADKRRKEAVLWCENAGVYFGTSKQAVISGLSAHLPAGGSATIRHQDAIWVRGDTATALVSYIMELYGD